MKDRRHPARWQINTKAKLALEGAVADVDCIVHDLSFNGARISLIQRLPQDTPLKINITLAEGFSFEVEIWVAWYKQIMERSVYGVYFNRIKDADKETIYKFMYQNFPDALKISGWKIPLEVKGGEGKMAQNGFRPDQDRRVFERILISLPVKLLDLDENRELEVNTCDLSAKGLGIVSNEYLKSGDRLELWLNMPDKREPFYTRGAVVWSKLQGKDEYRTGISLEKAEFMGMSRLFRT